MDTGGIIRINIHDSVEIRPIFVEIFNFQEFLSRQKCIKRSKPCILKFLKGSGNRKTTNQSGRLFKSVNLVFIRRQLDRDLSFRSQRVSAAVSRSESAAD